MKGADPASLQQKIQQWALQSNQSVSNWVIHSTSRSSFNGQNLMSYHILLLPEVNFPPPLPPPLRTAEISSVGEVWIFSGTTHYWVISQNIHNKFPHLEEEIGKLTHLPPLDVLNTHYCLCFKSVDSAKVATGRQLDCFRELLENPPDTFNSTSQLLLRIATNIVQEPNEPKYRTLKLSTNTFQNKLLPVKGAVECLFAMGFEDVSTGQNEYILNITIIMLPTWVSWCEKMSYTWNFENL